MLKMSRAKTLRFSSIVLQGPTLRILPDYTGAVVKGRHQIPALAIQLASNAPRKPPRQFQDIVAIT